uniref:Reverse transcriptase n=1 Tax=Rhynchosciara americana TaxID=7186 RepID=B8Y0J4_RHYAM|nr:reverse transcriptase [Rhynchosciara americana]
MSNYNETNTSGGDNPRMATQTTGSLSSGPINQHTCELCCRTFGTRAGLGQHVRKTHPIESNQSINVERKKRRWSPEEIRRMANMEAQATINNIKHLTQYLATYLPQRTLNAIKGRRRDAEYKELVTGIIANLRSNSSTQQTNQVCNESEMSQRSKILQSIRESVRDLRSRRNKYAKALQELGEAALCGKMLNEEQLIHCIKSMFNTAKCPKGPRFRKTATHSGTNKQQRQQRYARVQKLYKMNRKVAAKMVLEETDKIQIKLPDHDPMFKFWESEFKEGEGMPERMPKDLKESPDLKAIWDPVTEEEVRKAKVANNTAAGPDGIQPKSWNRISLKYKTLIYNLLLYYEKVPHKLKVSRTVFIPKKKDGSSDPGEFRPLTICSVVLRGFNKILVQRLVSLYKYDERQTAYLPIDGVGTNIHVLAAILNDSNTKLSELHVALLDITKAFNRLHHTSIIKSLVGKGFPYGFITFIRRMYTGLQTMMQFEGHCKMTQVNRGVYQGDPLSGPIFLLAIEKGLQALDKEVGYDIGDVRVNAGAYADDTDLVAGTRLGLQDNINRFSSTIKQVGLEVNPRKSMTLSLVPSGKEKKMKVETGKPFRANDVPLKELSINDFWRYLGISYTNEGPERLSLTIEQDLERLTKAPLKPQQRIHMLNAYVIPKYQDKLVLSKTTAKGLKRTDRQIRQYVRRWLKLPHDVPIAYLHAPVKSGGLNIPCLQYWIPLLRVNRVNKITESQRSVLAAVGKTALLTSTVYKCNQSLATLGGNPTMLAYRTYWEKELYAKVDGKDLQNARDDKASTRWNGMLHSDISGEDYLNYHKLRTNSVPTKVRTARGRPQKETSCRGGCKSTETLQHVVQQCHRTHGGRTLRHDRIVGLLQHELRRDYNVLAKQELKTGIGLRKPDLVLIKDDTAHIVDVQVARCSKLNESHVRKRSKYDKKEIEVEVKSRYRVSKVMYEACTISYKGIWDKQSVMSMRRLGVSEYCLFKIVTSTLRGTWLCWKRFNMITSVRS